MSWTNETAVRAHLVNLDRSISAYSDEAAVVNADGAALLAHRGVAAASEVVKRIAELDPVGPVTVTLNGEIWSGAPDAQLIPSSLVAADGWKLDAIYLEDIDYVLDAAAGKIRRVTGGAISDGASVKLFYRRYEVLVRDVDYEIDYAAGEIMAVAGTFEPGATLYVDYALDLADAAGALIVAAITEAENKILLRLKSDYGASSTDQGLVTGATELASAIVCRGLAAQALADGLPAAASRSKQWLQLAHDYETASVITLKPFVKSPVIQPGGKGANNSWEWN